jgi:alpha-mannosidase
MTTAPVVADGTSLSNGLITVTVDPATGTYAIDGTTGLGRVVESGDLGDTYNYCPPDHDVVISDAAEVTVTLVEHGPVRGRIGVVSSYRWPERADDDGHRLGEVDTTVSTTIELRAGERFVRVSQHWDNASRDHRVRAVFDLPDPVATSYAECAFGVVARGLDPEGGPTELPLATYPSRRFVRAGTVTVVHDGLLEYELTGDTLALTLVRSTGMLSRVDLPTRPLPAGPPIAVDGAQVQGPLDVTYAVSVDASVDPYAMADEVLTPLMTVRAPGGGPVDALAGQGLHVEGAEVSAVLRSGTGLVVRMFNPTAEPVTARVAGRTGWIIDLRDRPIAPFEEMVPLRPREIVTVRC